MDDLEATLYDKVVAVACFIGAVALFIIATMAHQNAVGLIPLILCGFGGLLAGFPEAAWTLTKLSYMFKVENYDEMEPGCRWTASRKFSPIFLLLISIWFTIVIFPEDVAFGAASSGGSASSNPGYAHELYDTIEFGSREWLVLDEEDGRLLLLSAYCISSKIPFDKQTNSWEHSSVREYLNDDFYNGRRIFSNEERSRIVEVSIPNREGDWYDEEGTGRATRDKIFLLSLEEVLLYFGDSGELGKTQSTVSYFSDDCNDARVAYNEIDIAVSWWLRTPGITTTELDPRTDKYITTCTAIYVFTNGSITLKGDLVHRTNYIRPAMWITAE